MSSRAEPREIRQGDFTRLAKSYAHRPGYSHGVLRPGGHFTALWNPRNVQANPLHARIEARIGAIVPELKRRSSGSYACTADLARTLVSTGHFTHPLFVEDEYEIRMSEDRCLGAWRSVNDIQAQAGPERFARILAAIEEEIAPLDEIVVPYRTRAWTVRRVDV